MHIETQHIVIRAFVKEDAETLFRIVRESDIYRFMPDWTDGFLTARDYDEAIEWFGKQQDNTDITYGRRYAIALPDSNQMIGMVGVGLEETLNEVEIAYFMSRKYQRKGYTKEAVDALVDWCFKVSDVKYLILTIDCANTPSINLAEKCGFALFEKRTPINHKQPNMESESYFYYRKYRVPGERKA